MDSTRFDFLARSLTDPSSRRGIGRALAGLTLGGAIGSLLGLTGAEAKKKGKRKKKRRRNRPFCAGKNHCESNNGLCSRSGADNCFCWPTVEGGKPFCGRSADVFDCSKCIAGETCVDFSECGLVAEGCATPCPDPL